MKSFAYLSAVLALGFTLVVGDAEAARRLGGGRSSGMQREAVTQPAAPAGAMSTPGQATAPMAARSQPAAGAPQAQPKRSWMGPLAGLAAGIGLAALASHFGFGEELASMMMIALAVVAVLALVGFIMRRRAAAQQPAMAGMHYAGAGAGFGRARDAAPDFTPAAGGGYAPAAAGAAAATAAPTAGRAGNIPADFDVAGFVRNAKVNFIRLQAANDAGNLDDIREFTTPEMFGEIKLSFSERGATGQETDVVSLEAEVIDVAEEAARYVVSVRFHGLIREDKGAAAEPFDEVWNMVKPRDGSRGWVLAGIQQVQ